MANLAYLPTYTYLSLSPAYCFFLEENFLFTFSIWLLERK